MKDDFKNNDELMDQLLKEYILEDGGNDPAVKRALDISSEYVFEHEPVLEPGGFREKQLDALRKKSRGFHWNGNGKLLLGVFLAGVAIGIYLLLAPSSNETPVVAAPQDEFTKPERVEQMDLNPALATIPDKKAAGIDVLPVNMASIDEPPSVVPPDEPEGSSLPVSAAPSLVDFAPLLERLKAATRHTQDRLYMMTDKSLYRTGERIWLSVYVCEAATMRKSQTSDIVHVHLINPKNQVEESIRLIAEDGIAKGDFFLNARYPGGLYKLKTYTNWQKNEPGIKLFEKEIQVQQLVHPNIKVTLEFEQTEFSSGDLFKARVKFQNSKGNPVKDFAFRCKVTIAGDGFREFDKVTDETGNASLEFELPKDIKKEEGFLNFYFDYNGNIECVSEQIPLKNDKIQFEAYPESGQLVAGIKSRVAFQTLDGAGFPVEVTGQVIDDSGNTVATFSSLHDGMGLFEFTPQAGTPYHVKILNPSGAAETFSLPEVTQNGFVVQVEKTDEENVSLIVKATTASHILLAASQRGKVFYSQEHHLIAGNNSIEIPTKDLPMGVVQITVFDHNRLPQAERLVFVNGHKKLHVEITADKQLYQPREKVKLSVTVQDDNGKPHPANLSLSVAEGQLIAQDNSADGNILSKLFLEPDLNGKVFNPGFYFNGDEINQQAIDLLLLTRGWRNFSWEENAAYSYSSEEAVVAGRILDPVTGMALEGVEISIEGSDNKILTDKSGKFRLPEIRLEKGVTLLALVYEKQTMSYYLNDYDDNLEIIFYGDGKKIYQPSESGVRHPLEKALKKSSGDNSIIIGKVVERNYQPLAMAVVSARQNGRIIISDTTDAHGYYQLELAVAGVYDLVVSHDNYRDHSNSAVNIGKGKAVLFDVLMSDEKTIYEMADAGYASSSVSSDYPIKLPVLKTTEFEVSSGVDYEQLLSGFSDVYGVDETGNIYIKGFHDRDNIYVDGVRLDFNQPVSIPRAGIDQVNVYNTGTPARYEDHNGSIIEIKTIEPGAAGGETKKESKEQFVSRYYLAKEFPKIEYGTGQPARKNDIRTTLCWQGDLVIDESGVAVIEFYSSDISGTFKALVEGISVDGLAGVAVVEFETGQK